MNNVESILSYAENNCKAHGARLTNKRKQVLSGLLKSQKAMSAYELVDFCREEFGEKIPPMSVYRILDFLEEEGLVHKLNLANKYIACSHIACNHDHGVQQFLICSNCQRVEEITIDKSVIDLLQSNVEQAGFNLLSPQLEMNCLCSDCRNSAS